MYDFQRVHRGIDGVVPADRFFGAADEVLRTLKQRVADNALQLARHGQPREPFYVTGQVAGQSFSVHAEGERLVLRRENEPRQEVTLAGEAATPATHQPQLPEPLCPAGAEGSMAAADEPCDESCDEPCDESDAPEGACEQRQEQEQEQEQERKDPQTGQAGGEA